MNFAHTFADNPLDRADWLVLNEDKLVELAQSPDAHFLPLWQLQVLINDVSATPTLGFICSDDIQWKAIEAPAVFLGLMEERAYFALDISCQKDPASVLRIAEGWEFSEAFRAASLLPAPEAGILAHARARVDWHKKHQFCAVCGSKTKQLKGGRQRNCEDCGADHFPRTDPVVIMLIEHEDQCLLGQPHGPLVQMGIWSALAGFIDQGETIEEAVRREIMEEAGIQVGAVEYHSSQPWPFPSSLMIGCRGQARSTKITVDPVEMHDVRWFGRDEVRSVLMGADNLDFKLPGPIAIAHHLITDWASE